MDEKFTCIAAQILISQHPSKMEVGCLRQLCASTLTASSYMETARWQTLAIEP